MAKIVYMDPNADLIPLCFKCGSRADLRLNNVDVCLVCFRNEPKRSRPFMGLPYREVVVKRKKGREFQYESIEDLLLKSIDNFNSGD